MNEELEIRKIESLDNIIEPRVAARKLYDTYDVLVPHGPLRTPSPEMLSRIARILRLKRSDNKKHSATFPRCYNRDFRIARKLDEEQGFTVEDMKADRGVHTRSRHVCALCRCKRPAGWGSKGWWYWPPSSGLPEVGHYGVGPCFLHGPHYRQYQGGGEKLDEFRLRIAKEIEAMIHYGEAPDTNGGYLVDMRAEAEVARQRQDTRTALHALHALADETITALRRHRSRPEAGDDFVREVCGIFAFPEDMLDKNDRSRLLELSLMRPLTEYVSGTLRPMSDATAIDLERGLLKDVSAAAKTAFTVHEEQYTSNDDVLLLLERFYSAAEMAFRARGEEDWLKFVGELKDIGRGFADKSIEASAVVAGGKPGKRK